MISFGHAAFPLTLRHEKEETYGYGLQKTRVSCVLTSGCFWRSHPLCTRLARAAKVRFRTIASSRLRKLSHFTKHEEILRGFGMLGCLLCPCDIFASATRQPATNWLCWLGWRSRSSSGQKIRERGKSHFSSLRRSSTCHNLFVTMASHNTVFVAHFVHPNPPSADFTNTENVRRNPAFKVKEVKNVLATTKRNG